MEPEAQKIITLPAWEEAKSLRDISAGSKVFVKRGDLIDILEADAVQMTEQGVVMRVVSGKWTIATLESYDRYLVVKECTLPDNGITYPICEAEVHVGRVYLEKKKSEQSKLL